MRHNSVRDSQAQIMREFCRDAIEIWSRIPSEIKNKTCLALFSEEYKKYVQLAYNRNILCVLIDWRM